MIGTCPKCGISNENIIAIVRALLDDVGENAVTQARSLERTMERTAAAMAQAEVVADLAADRVLRRIRGPLSRLKNARVAGSVAR